MMNLMPLPAKALNLVPHEGRMCMVDEVVSLGQDGAVVRACAAADGLLVSAVDGRLEEVMFAELVAQAYAAYRGYELMVSGLPPRDGFLVAIRQLDVLGSAYAGEELMVTVSTVGSLDGFAVVAGEVRRGEILLARAKLKIFIPEGTLP